jgi:hypothetical protein
MSETVLLDSMPEIPNNEIWEKANNDWQLYLRLLSIENIRSQLDKTPMQDKPTMTAFLLELEGIVEVGPTKVPMVTPIEKSDTKKVRSYLILSDGFEVAV